MMNYRGVQRSGESNGKKCGKDSSRGLGVRLGVRDNYCKTYHSKNHRHQILLWSEGFKRPSNFTTIVDYMNGGLRRRITKSCLLQKTSPLLWSSSISYQLEILGTAIERNTIVLLETGCEKTHIAVLLMDYIVQNLKKEHKECLIIFLAPAVSLVKQQFEYITRHINLRVAYYIGGKAVKDWKEATLNEVLVMTPQILLDGLDSNSLTLDKVNLLVLDECHHASKNHPYAKIMRVYQTMSQHKPKIFGMSASLVTKKGVSSSTDCEKQIAQIEKILDAQAITVKDKRELESFLHTPKQITKFYSLSIEHQPLQKKMVSLPHLFEESKAKSIRANVEYCLQNLGFFCAFKAVQLYSEKEKLREIATGTVEMEQYAHDDYLT